MMSWIFSTKIVQFEQRFKEVKWSVFIRNSHYNRYIILQWTNEGSRITVFVLCATTCYNKQVDEAVVIWYKNRTRSMQHGLVLLNLHNYLVTLVLLAKKNEVDYRCVDLHNVQHTDLVSCFADTRYASKKTQIFPIWYLAFSSQRYTEATPGGRKCTIQYVVLLTLTKPP